MQINNANITIPQKKINDYKKYKVVLENKLKKLEKDTDFWFKKLQREKNLKSKTQAAINSFLKDLDEPINFYCKFYEYYPDYTETITFKNMTIIENGKERNEYHQTVVGAHKDQKSNKVTKVNFKTDLEKILKHAIEKACNAVSLDSKNFLEEINYLFSNAQNTTKTQLDTENKVYKTFVDNANKLKELSTNSKTLLDTFTNAVGLTSNQKIQKQNEEIFKNLQDFKKEDYIYSPNILDNIINIVEDTLENLQKSFLPNQKLSEIKKGYKKNSVGLTREKIGLDANNNFRYVIKYNGEEIYKEKIKYDHNFGDITSQIKNIEDAINYIGEIVESQNKEWFVIRSQTKQKYKKMTEEYETLCQNFNISKSSLSTINKLYVKFSEQKRKLKYSSMDSDNDSLPTLSFMKSYKDIYNNTYDTIVKAKSSLDDDKVDEEKRWTTTFSAYSSLKQFAKLLSENTSLIIELSSMKNKKIVGDEKKKIEKQAREVKLTVNQIRQENKRLEITLKIAQSNYDSLVQQIKVSEKEEKEKKDMLYRKGALFGVLFNMISEVISAIL